MNKSCDTCMLKKRGDCFGEVQICALYEHSPSGSSSEINNWPVIMRSNSQSRYLEWKKEQKRLASYAKIKRKESPPRTKRENSNEYSNMPAYQKSAPIATKRTNEETRFYTMSKPQSEFAQEKKRYD